MKKYLRFPLYMVVAAMLGTSVVACSDDDEPNVTPNELTAQE